MSTDKERDIPASVVAALSQGQKIEAIKLLREANAIGLKEAKDAVEEYIKSRPELSMRLAAMQKESIKGFFRWVIILVVLSLMAYWLLTRR